MDGDGEWRQVKVCQCPGSGEREPGLCVVTSLKLMRRPTLATTHRPGERTERHRSWASQSEQFSFLSHLFVFKKMAQSLKIQEYCFSYLVYFVSGEGETNSNVI